MIETQLDSCEIIVCTPWGDLDWIGATSLRHVMGNVLQPGIEAVIDLSHVDSLDGAGISALLGSSRRARSIGCTVRIRNASPELRQLLERFGFQEIPDYLIDDDNDAA